MQQSEKRDEKLFFHNVFKRQPNDELYFSSSHAKDSQINLYSLS